MTMLLNSSQVLWATPEFFWPYFCSSHFPLKLKDQTQGIQVHQLSIFFLIVSNVIFVDYCERGIHEDCMSEYYIVGRGGHNVISGGGKRAADVAERGQ